jgi:hypothetical protein
MNSKRSAKQSRRFHDSRQVSGSRLGEAPEIHKPAATGSKSQDQSEWHNWEENCTPELLKEIHEANEGLRKKAPWLYANRDEARMVAARAVYPRSKFGDNQDDRFFRAIYFSIQPGRGAALDFHEIVNAGLRQTVPDEVSQNEAAPEGSFFWAVDEVYKLAYPGEPFIPSTFSEFFDRIAKTLKHFETYKPTVGDFAVEALQSAFVGLMEHKYAWHKNDLPTKGEVIAMAKEHLERKGKTKSSGWTAMLEKAGLDWLPSGQAGRPSKGNVDKNLKAKQEFLSKQTKYVNETTGGDWRKLLEQTRHVFGGKIDALEHEEQRLNETYGQPANLDEGGTE